jgi:hypothetical protein
MVSIRDRPEAADDRTKLGPWEGDLVMGKRPSAVATLVERSTRYLRIVPLPDGYKADAVSGARCRPGPPGCCIASFHPCGGGGQGAGRAGGRCLLALQLRDGFVSAAQLPDEPFADAGTPWQVSCAVKV